MITLNSSLEHVFGETIAASRFVIRTELLKMIAGRPTLSDTGLCVNIELALLKVDLASVDLRPLFLSWDHFSGFDIYPLPGTRLSYHDHWDGGTLWTDPEQLRLRKSLALHVLNCLDQYISNLSR